MVLAAGARTVLCYETTYAVQGNETVSLSDRPTLREEDRKRLCDGLSALAIHGAERGVTVVYHPHAKNIRPDVLAQVEEEGLSFLQAVRRGVFTVPGDPDGCVAFLPTVRAAAAAGCEDWLVIEAEQESAVRDPLHFQRRGLRSLRAFAQQAGLS